MAKKDDVTDANESTPFDGEAEHTPSVAELSDTVRVLTESQAELKSMMVQMLGSMRSSSVKIGAEEMVVMDAPTFSDQSSEDFMAEMNTRERDINAPEFKSKMDELRFNEEILTIRLHDAMTDESGDIVDVQCNNQHCIMRTGGTYNVKRKFVGVLLSSFQILYNDKMIKDNAGNDTVVHPSRRVDKHPFDVIEDKNPRGRAWLQRVRMQA
jgi:hypothetical protein